MPTAGEPLLPESTAAADTNGNIVRRITVRDHFQKLVDVVIARAPTNGARVTESLDYEPIQNDLYFQRLKARRGTRHVYGCAREPTSTTSIHIVVDWIAAHGLSGMGWAVVRGEPELTTWPCPASHWE
jgi:hypothetical protein